MIISNIKEHPADERYRRFKVDKPAIVEKSSSLEHKNFKQLIKDNNIKPVKRRNGKEITINVSCPCCGALKNTFTIIMVNSLSLNVKFVLMSFL